MRIRAERIEAMARTLYLAAETDLATVLGQIDAARARARRRRLGADHQQRAGRGLGRQRQPGPRGRRGADPGGQGPRHRRAARRARHQGRLDRRAPGARAPRRRRRAVRGRPALAAAAGAGGQEPLRPHRRGGLLRPVRHRHRGAHRPQRAVPVRPHHRGRRHLRHGHPRGSPPAGRRGAGPGHQVHPGHAAPGHLRARRRPGQHDPGRARQAGQRPDRRQRRLRVHGRAGSGSPSRPPTSRSAWPWPGPSPTRPLPPGTIAFGEVGLAGEIRPVTGVHRRLAEAHRLGFTRAVVPPGVLGGGPVPDGIRVLEADTVAQAVIRGLHQAG